MICAVQVSLGCFRAFRVWSPLASFSSNSSARTSTIKTFLKIRGGQLSPSWLHALESIVLAQAILRLIFHQKLSFVMRLVSSIPVVAGAKIFYKD